MYAKRHEKEYKGLVRTVIAVCDADLLGKVHEGSRGTVLDLKTYRDFYAGEKVTVAQLGELLDGEGNVNLVGKKSIAAASKFIPVSLKDARVIGGVPHLQYYRIR